MATWHGGGEVGCIYPESSFLSVLYIVWVLHMFFTKSLCFIVLTLHQQNRIEQSEHKKSLNHLNLKARRGEYQGRARTSEIAHPC